MNKNIIRDGDTVRIVIPDFFIRCGYPWTKKYVIENVITKEQKKLAWDFLINFGILPAELPLDNQLLMEVVNNDQSDIHEKLIYFLSQYVLEQHSWGGKERKIYTQRIDDLKDKELTVTGRKVVKTGTYYPPYSDKCWTDYGYEYDYEPGGLDNMETHVIFRLGYFNSYKIGDSYDIWIEKKNVVKVVYE